MDVKGFNLRLSKVKLSGFKSFVDPTTFDLTGRLNGIVGPNGCGKSNIIDAVRWVMGESSARQLRGESMSDVIFNGSSHRKPSGFANIELVFDNSQGLLGGKWAAYNEINIRRYLDREGKSQYFLNGVRCRRRDITDIFMGTGLGPRSYAIIEQGMISRIVESKPDELRIFFEEAANISKYKERKKETEQSIKHTRENLSRLSDIRGELAKQLSHLQKQARTAERFQILRQEERLLDYWCLESQRERLSQQLAAIHASQTQGNDRFQEGVEHFNQVTLQLIEAKKTFDSEESTQKSERHAYYEHKQQIEQVKHELALLNELKCRDAKNLEEWNERGVFLANDVNMYTERIADVQINMADAETEIIIHEEHLNALDEQLIHAREKHQRLHEEDQRLQKELAVLQQKVTLLDNQYHFEKEKRESWQQQLVRLEANNNHYLDEHSEIILQNELEAALETYEEKRRHLEVVQNKVSEKLTNINESLRSLHNEKNSHYQKRSELQGRINVLMAFNSSHVIDDADAPLYRLLTVKEGWNKAFDHVLSRWLMIATENTTEADGKSYFHGQVDLQYSPEQLGFYVDTKLLLGSILSHVYILKDRKHLAKARRELKTYEWLVTQTGDIYGKDWYIAYHEKQDNNGLLEREGQIEATQNDIEQIDDALDIFDNVLMKSEAEKLQLTANIAANTEQLRTIKEDIHAKEKQLELVKQESKHKQREKKRIQEERAAINEQLASSEERLVILQASIDEDSNLLEDKKGDYFDFKKTVEEAEKIFIEEKSSSEHKRFAFMDSKRHLEQLIHQQNNDQQALQRAENELNGIRLRIAEKDLATDYEKKIAENSEQLVILEALFVDKIEILERLEAEIDQFRERILSLDNQKNEREKEIYLQKEQLQQFALKEAELTTQKNMLEETWQNLKDNLSDSEIDEFILTHNDLSETLVRAQLVKVKAELNKIGAVNLVAIEESKNLAERKKYLDEQDEDLNKALDTLEKAIREIDKETRERFMETFTQVNIDFSNLFPQLFGGGNAYLELTDNDALTSGVNIIAHPPGKKAGTIHLLSGGEKALTAMALVFSIFNLNPAPFCMLDEVDAPLDESNVIRLGKLIDEMSSKVQFIFITHNKATMSISDSLIGVTMAEPGVSRLVSVNLKEAMQFSEADSLVL